ncbi:MAG: iron-containing alcohol dehydrogenase family protein [Oscillatoriaceae bacterium SKW80]|nr:iron-containing alcohol dehydrogenase family protein [Oscillatoriaceae bacterium SKYG93]MCX8121044.1 iron-containing alcohol dehydrogenase family protein [Oscillatoriaceae bacterium SKW80]MDW8452317.1 iron-containing alcohol dehydrogenase family protein [Oscillatoriaceae cyanobacterium SKYGB_i_bin93]HIK26651.1 iron-containing alcohol dehydrogenase family protein [Oscillatoriaceae cyanobacterium M7585_C2015_266]
MTTNRFLPNLPNSTEASTGIATLATMTVAPTKIIRGTQILTVASEEIARLGQRPLIVGGERTLTIAQEALLPPLQQQKLEIATISYSPDCSEARLEAMRQAALAHRADLIIGIGGGKALDAAKLLAHWCRLPVVTIPTSGATCAACTALSNVYTDAGAFVYDVPLRRCPDLLLLDYDIIATAPLRTIRAGIGDALAKWYEASVSSGHSEQTLLIAAVQQARVLRDILLQKSVAALKQPGSPVWREVVDATVLLAGVIGGLGGAQCRTVAAHAVHNGLTQLHNSRNTLHGEKVAYGILVQLRLEEMIQGNQLAAAARQQLLKFYSEIELPSTLAHLGLGNITLGELRQAAEFACSNTSDIHRLPFKVVPEQLMAAMVSTTVPVEAYRQTGELVGANEESGFKKKSP